MSFSIQIENNIQERNEIYKTPILIATYTGTLKTETSIVDPSILLECNLADIASANYMTIPSFNRSYFITNITSVRTGLVQIDAHCDVLSSFKNEIMLNRAVIKRQESAYNLYTEDKQMKYFTEPIITVKKFPSGFSGFTTVLALAGNGSSTAVTTWIVEAYENAQQSLYTTTAGGTGVFFTSNVMGAATLTYNIGSKYFKPGWTEDGVYDNINNRISGPNIWVGDTLPNRNTVKAYRNNVGYDTYLQEALCVYANSDPNDPELLVKYNLVNNTSENTAQEIDLPHSVKYVAFQWAEVGSS